MIVVLHGDDIAASYARLSQIIEKYKNHLKVNLTKPGETQILEAAFATDLISQDKLIIVESFLAPQKKLNVKFFQKIPQDKNIIFWEKTPLTPAKINHLQKQGKVEFFKQKSDLFPFIDTIGQNLKMSLSYLCKLDDENNLVWQIENRLLLMLLSKLNMSLNSVVEITKRKVFDWQWERVKSQTAKFDIKSLQGAYSASLKLDYLIKSGKTDLGAKTLISAFLIKYLK